MGLQIGTLTAEKLMNFISEEEESFIIDSIFMRFSFFASFCLFWRRKGRKLFGAGEGKSLLEVDASKIASCLRFGRVFEPENHNKSLINFPPDENWGLAKCKMASLTYGHLIFA